MKKDFLSIADLSVKEIWQVLLHAKKLKQSPISSESNKIFENKNMVMLFEKPSLRTKLSFDLAWNSLGGHSVYFGAQEVGLGKREEVTDVAKVISSMADIIVARVFKHTDLEDLAQNSTISVINALSDKEHPCQALADFLTIYEIKSKLKGLNMVFVGDSKNNVAVSLKLGAKLLGINFIEGSPFSDSDPEQIFKNADVIYTDTWVSMGEESSAQEKIKLFKKFQVTSKLMKLAKKDAIFMHCLPAHKGQEVSREVFDGPQSVVFQQAENRLHAQKALIIYLLKNNIQKKRVENPNWEIFLNL